MSPTASVSGWPTKRLARFGNLRSSSPMYHELCNPSNIIPVIRAQKHKRSCNLITYRLQQCTVDLTKVQMDRWVRQSAAEGDEQAARIQVWLLTKHLLSVLWPSPYLVGPKRIKPKYLIRHERQLDVTNIKCPVNNNHGKLRGITAISLWRNFLQTQLGWLQPLHCNQKV